MLFVIEADERNVVDQKIIEVKLQQQFGIFSMRRTLSQIASDGSIDPNTKQLSIDDIEIGFVYFRTGYQAEQYCVDGTLEWDERKWQAREMMELSMAVKCPSIDFHLTTFKKFQQSFSDENLLR